MQVLVHARKECHEGTVLAELFQATRGNEPEHANRIVLRTLPCILVDPAKEIDGGRVPAPSQVHGDGEQALERLRQRRSNREAPEGPHASMLVDIRNTASRIPAISNG